MYVKGSVGRSQILGWWYGKYRMLEEKLMGEEAHQAT
jgi:hypothetical protein